MILLFEFYLQRKILLFFFGIKKSFKKLSQKIKKNIFYPNFMCAHVSKLKKPFKK